MGDHGLLQRCEFGKYGVHCIGFVIWKRYAVVDEEGEDFGIEVDVSSLRVYLMACANEVDWVPQRLGHFEILVAGKLLIAGIMIDAHVEVEGEGIDDITNFGW